MAIREIPRLRSFKFLVRMPTKRSGRRWARITLSYDQPATSTRLSTEPVLGQWAVSGDIVPLTADAHTILFPWQIDLIGQVLANPIGWQSITSTAPIRRSILINTGRERNAILEGVALI